MYNIKGAIFDVDGTMLDTEQTWDSVTVDYLKSRGKTPKADLIASLQKLGGNQIPDYFRAEYGITESAEEIHNAINKMLEKVYFNDACMKAGVMETLEQFRRSGIKMCVATATDRYLVEAGLRRCGIFEYFGRVFTCPEEQTSKREPDIFLSAAKYLGTAPGETIVFEDALYAIESSKRAGFIVAAVYDLSASGSREEIKSIADLYYDSLSEFCLSDIT